METSAFNAAAFITSAAVCTTATSVTSRNWSDSGRTVHLLLTQLHPQLFDDLDADVVFGFAASALQLLPQSVIRLQERTNLLRVNAVQIVVRLADISSHCEVLIVKVVEVVRGSRSILRFHGRKPEPRNRGLFKMGCGADAVVADAVLVATVCVCYEKSEVGREHTLKKNDAKNVQIQPLAISR
jgi:hypothetical protein